MDLFCSGNTKLPHISAGVLLFHFFIPHFSLVKVISNASSEEVRGLSGAALDRIIHH